MMRLVLPAASLFLLSMVVCIATTPLAKRIALHVGAVDKPSARRINTVATPRMGGIAIFGSITIALAAARLLPEQFSWIEAFNPAYDLKINYNLLYLSFCCIFITGILDDIITLTPKQKLLGQVLAASIAAASGLVVGEIVNPLGDTFISLGWLAYPVTIIYLVSYVNIINLIDGLDGLAAGISGIAALTMFVLSIWSQMATAAIIALAVAGACAGFLRYNFHPACIFMGDSGSLTLGFALGTIALLSVSRLAGLTTIIVPLVVAGIPIIDTMAAIIRRTRAHVSFTTADKGHIHHRLMMEGYDQTQAVSMIYAWTSMLCFGSLAMTQVQVGPRLVIFAALIGLSGLFIQHLHLLDPVLMHYRNTQSDIDDGVHSRDQEKAATDED